MVIPLPSANTIILMFYNVQTSQNWQSTGVPLFMWLCCCIASNLDSPISTKSKSV